MSENGGTLAPRMRRLAQERPEIADEFNRLADALDAITMETPIPKMVGTWAKARRRWCEETGESLI